jgi:hypothetical protein
LNTCSFLWFAIKYGFDVDTILDILHLVFLPNSHFVAARMLTNFSFRCFVYNNDHMVHNEIAPLDFSNFLGNFVFPHFEDVPMFCLHIDHAYALLLIYLCCANRVMERNGHVIHDMLLYHAQTRFAWSLVRRYYSLNGYMVTTTSRTTHLPPLFGDAELSSRTTLFEGGGDDVVQVTVITMSSTPTYAKPPWLQKVNSFLFENPETSPLDGILLDHRPSYIARCDMTSTEVRGGCQESPRVEDIQGVHLEEEKSEPKKQKGQEAPSAGWPAWAGLGRPGLVGGLQGAGLGPAWTRPGPGLGPAWAGLGPAGGRPGPGLDPAWARPGPAWHEQFWPFGRFFMFSFRFCP